MDNVYEKINETKFKYKALRNKLKEELIRLNELKEERDSKNFKTQELISSLKELEHEINNCETAKKKETLGYKKKKLEHKLIINKKAANEDHKNYIKLKKKIDKEKKKIKKYKVI